MRHTVVAPLALLFFVRTAGAQDTPAPPSPPPSATTEPAAATVVTTPATPPTPEAVVGHATGLALEARLSQSAAPLGLGLAAGTTLASIFGGPPAGAIGYRGRSFALLIGPSFTRIGVDSALTSSCTGSGCSTTTGTDSVILIGAQIIADFRLLESADKRTEGYLLGGVSLAGASISPARASTSSSGSSDDGISGKPAFGVLGGFGLRYWLAPSLGLGAEIGESYVNFPIGSVTTSGSTIVNPSGSTSSPAKTDLRAGVLSTFGSFTVALAFGGS